MKPHRPDPSPSAEPQWQRWRLRVPGAPPDVVVHLVELPRVRAWALRETGCLAEHEVARAQALEHEPRRQDYLVSRVVLRALLAQRVGCARGEVGLSRDPITAAPLPPRLPGVRGGGRVGTVRYSLARTPGYVLVVIGERAVGTDLEARQTPQQAALLVHMLHPDDRARLLRLATRRRARAVTDAWVRVEALLKARGEGLGTDPATVPVTAGHRVRYPDEMIVTGVRTRYAKRVHAAVAWCDRPGRAP